VAEEAVYGSFGLCRALTLWQAQPFLLPASARPLSCKDLANRKPNLDTIQHIFILIYVKGLPHAVASCHDLLLIW
jgi:hypothetical protein